MHPQRQGAEGAGRSSTVRAEAGAGAVGNAGGCAALLIEDSAVARHIFKHLDPEDLLLSATLVCRQWRRHTRAMCAEWKQELGGETQLSVSGLC